MRAPRRRPAALAMVLAVAACGDRGQGTADRDWDALPRTVTVEVWNGGGEPGAARDAALRLRRGGLDVVNWENAPAAQRDTAPRPTRVLVRGGDSTGAGRVAEILGPIEVIDAPDPTRLVDLTVVVMRDSS